MQSVKWHIPDLCDEFIKLCRVEVIGNKLFEEIGGLIVLK